MKKTSIQTSYYFSIVANIILLISSIGCGSFIITRLKKFVELLGKTFGLIFISLIVLAFIYMIIITLKNIFSLLKDYKSVKQKRFSYSIGKVIGFKKNRDPESGVQINDRPIVLIIDTNEVVELIINDKVTIGKTYAFNYLKNCKIAEVVKEV